jgi:serine/threonine protein kinase
MQRRCPVCQQLNRDAAQFCAFCGTRMGPSPSAVLALQPGQLLKDGAYRVIRRLTKGGMGALYLAKDLRTFSRPVVIKQMLDYYDPAAADGAAKARSRFEEEGRTLASLSHPGIPKIYAFFEEAGRHYIVMEYIEGDNLAQYVTRVDEAGRPLSSRRLAPEQVLRYATQVAQVLEYLAGQPRPVIHQDVKPSNLILERSLDFVRLVDFGTASADGVPTAGDPESVYGTIGYASPEQCQGHPEPKSDVYALGATIYHLLTDDDPRDHPFKFPELGALSGDVRRVLKRALRQAADQRITASQLREELEALQNPKRSLQTFAFPTGERIRTVTALPPLADEQWDAARTLLYQGDFDRWLRDLNRHDAVLAAASARQAHQDQNAGLEAFLEQIDPGLSRPKLRVTPNRLNLGRVAREKPITEVITVGNAERGYLLAKLSAPQPWLNIEPRHLEALAYQATDVQVTVDTQVLPLRRTARGSIEVDAGPAGKASVEVVAQVSVPHELWRLLKRTARGAVPAAARGFQDGLKAGADLVSTSAATLLRRPWTVVAVWLLLALAGGFVWWSRMSSHLWQEYAVIALAAPPSITLLGVAALLLATSLIGFVAGGAAGALRGLLNVERLTLPHRPPVSRGLFRLARWWLERRGTQQSHRP